MLSELQDGPPPDARLIATAASGDLAGMRTLLQQGLPVNQVDLMPSPTTGMSPLMAAAKVGVPAGQRRRRCRLLLLWRAAAGRCRLAAEGCRCAVPPTAARPRRGS